MDGPSKDSEYEDIIAQLMRAKQEKDNPYYTGYDTEDTQTGYGNKQGEKRGYPLDYHNTQSPYYVGSAFATGDTLETLQLGAEKQATGWDEKPIYTDEHGVNTNEGQIAHDVITYGDDPYLTNTTLTNEEILAILNNSSNGWSQEEE